MMSLNNHRRSDNFHKFQFRQVMRKKTDRLMRNHFEFYRCNVRVIVILAFCSLSISKAMAQKEREYVPFVEEGKVWYCSYGSVGPITPEHPEGCNIKCIFNHMWRHVGK